MECISKLASFYIFKQEIVSKQKFLYELLSEIKIRDGIEEIEPGFEDSVVTFEDLKPDVNIKTELDYGAFKTSEEFDYADVHSGESEEFSSS